MSSTEKNSLQNFQEDRSVRAVAILIKEDKILLMHRINHGKEYYVFPGGGVEKGETVEEAVLREIKEEATLEIKIEKLLYRHIYDIGHEQFYYLCKYISGEPKLGEGNELEEMRTGSDNFYEPVWYDLKNLPETLLYPLEIRDWLIEDLKNNFQNTPREAKLKVQDLRQTL